MFLASFFVTAAALFYFSRFQQILYPFQVGTVFAISGLVALMGTMAESTSRNGSDNLSVPVISALVLDILIVQWNHGYFSPVFGWIMFSAFAFWFIMRSRWLTPDGAMGAWMMGIMIVGSQGWLWILYLFLFLVSASLLGKLKSGQASTFQAHGDRTIAQVYANGFVPMVIALAAFYYQSEQGIFLYLAAISAATADTWATEFGMGSKRPPRNVVTLKPLIAGQSGGVTALGFLGSFLGALFIAGSAILVTRDITILFLIIIAGFSGSLADSILGATVQAQYRCPGCGHPTEDSIHCGVKTEKTSGWSWINNHTVNLINTGIGAAIMYFWL